MDQSDDGVDLGQVVSPEQQGQGQDLFVRVILLSVLLGVVAVAQTHRGPDVGFVLSGWRQSLVSPCITFLAGRHLVAKIN